MVDKTSPSSCIDQLTMGPSKKRKRSEASNKESDTPVKISAAPPNPTALPPPIMTYSRTHLIPSYYPVYAQPSYFVSIGGQPPISPSLSPTAPSNSTTNNTTMNDTQTETINANNNNQHTNNQRILPKSPISNPASATSPSSLTAPFPFFPYPMQVSPQLHPTVGHPGSVSPNPYACLPATPSTSFVSSLNPATADQREQARKVSHSAIERRRREKINDKIIQLKQLIPTCVGRDNLHKMTILQSAIDYIVYLKDIIIDIDGNSERIENEKLFQASVLKQQSKACPEQSPAPQQDQADSIKKQAQIPHEEDEEEAEDNWSTSSSSPSLTSIKNIPTPVPTLTIPATPNPTVYENTHRDEHIPSISTPPSHTSLGMKPMDVITLNKKTQELPRIVIGSLENSPVPSPATLDRNMNLENILC